MHRIEPFEAQAIVDGSGRESDGPGGRPWHPGYPLDDEIDPIRALTTSSASPTDFTLYQIRLRASGVAIGGIGFFGAPDAEGAVTVGYGLVEAERGNGLATEALNVMIEFAARNGVRKVKADTAVDNLASQCVLQKARFAETRRSSELAYYELRLQRKSSSNAELRE